MRNELLYHAGESGFILGTLHALMANKLVHVFNFGL